jgi:hypothetical protein
MVGFFPFYSGRGGASGWPTVMALTPLKVGGLKEGLRGGGGLMVRGVKVRRWHLEVLSGGWDGRRWWKVVVAQRGLGRAGGRR